MARIWLDKKTGLPSTKKIDGQTFYLVGGSMQYFKGDVERIQSALRKRNIKFRTFKFRAKDAKFGTWVIYTNRTDIHLSNYRDPRGVK